MDKEKFRIWTSVVDVVSALAIVVSLLYVGDEIRQTQVLSQRGVDELLFSRHEESNRSSDRLRSTLTG